jgi:hypothetical protein
MGRPRECRLDRVEDGADLFGKSPVTPLDPPPGGSGLAGVLTPRGPEPFADLLGGILDGHSVAEVLGWHMYDASLIAHFPRP